MNEDHKGGSSEGECPQMLGEEGGDENDAEAITFFRTGYQWLSVKCQSTPNDPDETHNDVAHDE